MRHSWKRRGGFGHSLNARLDRTALGPVRNPVAGPYRAG